MKQYKTGGHHLKKILCAILSAALISVSAVPAFAAETSDKSETAVTLKEGTYAPNQVVVKFKDSAIDTDTVPKKGEVEAVGADFGELADASSSKQEALGAADEEADILSKSLGGDFVLEDTLVFDTPQADSKAGNSIGTSANANGDGFSVALVSSDKYDTATLIEKLSKVKGIEKVEPNYYVNTESLEIAPLYYTESDSLSDSFGINHSCAVTRDGIYYIYQTEDEYNRGWKLCLLPESSGVYESPFEKDLIWGDADGDGKVMISDATMIQKYLAEFEMPGNFVLESCDVDGDGSVTVSDVTCIQKYLAGFESGTGRTGEKQNAGTAHKLVKNVKKYTVDYLTKEWKLESTTNLTYQNAYPTVIEMVYSDEDLGSATTFLNYTFEKNIPKTCSVTYDYSDEKKTIEYNDGRVYNLHVEYESGGFSDTWYQYANGDGFFTSLFREDHIAATDFFPEQFAEETDSVQVTVENGLLKKTVNSGYYANWNEREPKKWLRFNGTYTAEYDSDGIAKTMSAVFRNGKDGIQYQIVVKKVNGVITEAVVKQPDGSGSLTETTKYEFEYTDAEISAARYSQMINYFIIGAGSNYYNNNWY